MCSYCGKRRAVHKDHVVPKSLYHRFSGELPSWFFDTVGSCAECNWMKGVSLFVPPSWADRLAELNALSVGRRRFEVWEGA